MSIIKRVCARYVVIVQTTGQVKQHYARDWDDALDWAACYDRADKCAIHQSFLGIVAVEPVAMRFA